ncbi:MAG TPA: DNA polymerase [Pyrinomonadaceae bacterium]|jgi:DNA polymerase I-like protein with 3'-5' exonuclease and polymerase domains|nr:DNA polymerase [Pyrinomonadaceae bacterium]
MSTPEYQLVTTAEGLRAACEELSRADAVGFDSETTSLDPYDGRMRLVQFAAPAAAPVLIDLDRFTGNGDAARSESLAPLRKLLAAPRPVKVAHNAKFDAKWVRHTLGVELGGVFDTMLASQLVSAGETEDRHSLAVVAGRYLGEDVDKTQQLSNWGGELSAAQLDYAARDAALMLPLRDALIGRLKSDGLVKVAQIEFECVLPVASMELAGIYLDAARWREQIEIVKKKRAVLAGELQGMLSEGVSQGSLFENARADINLDSHTQLTAALKRLGVPVPDSTRNWKLQPLAEKHEVVRVLLDYRTVQKSLTSYGENILSDINPKTGRIHANFHQIGAPTGRFACLAGDTLVPTSAGLKRMRDIREGDGVKTSFGFKKVLRSWATGVRQLYRLRLEDGRSVRATADHRFLTGRADVWKQLGELRPGDDLFVSLKVAEPGRAQEPPRIDAPAPEVRSRKPINLPTELSPGLCELMGLIVADGFLGRRRERPTARGRERGTPADYDRIRLAFDWQDEELIGRVVAHSRELFGQPFTPVKSRTCRVLQLASTKLAQFFAALGLGGNAHTKTVPGIILSAPAGYRAAFLRGLFEGDGCRSRDCVRLTSVNRRLLAEVQLMLSDLGIYSAVRRRNDASGFAGSDRYDLKIHRKSNLSRFMEVVGFLSERKSRPFDPAPQHTDGARTPFVVSGARLYREAVAAGTTEASREGVKPFITFYKGLPIKDESVRKLIERFGALPSLRPPAEYLALEVRPVRIESITPDEVEEVYDITVEGVHEFIANGIVVHNCTNPNVQQVPHAEEYRRCFRAQGPERKLIIADYSQIELRILAHVTEDRGFIEAFNSGADLHRVTAAQVFNVPLDGVTKEQRDFAKRLNFGVVYGIGAQRFAMMTGLPLSDAEQIMSRYFQTYRGLDSWLREAARRAVREKQARTMSGRLARFNFDPEDRQAASLAQRNGKNMPIQGASADILKRALRLLHDRLAGTTAEIVNIVHDEVVVEADADGAQEIAKAVEESMCAAGEEFVTRVPVKVEAEIGDEWVK